MSPLQLTVLAEVKITMGIAVTLRERIDSP
jgi:hypothetical protein